MTTQTTRPVEILTYAESEAIIGACSTVAPTGIRDAALIALLWRTGARIGEALTLKPRDIDLPGGLIRIRQGKTGPRTVAIEAAAHPYVARWIDTREHRLGFSGHKPMFCTLKGNAMSTTAARYMVKRRALRAGVEKRVHPHCFRHTFAAELAARGVPMNAIQMQLGHRSLAVTSDYLAHIQPQGLIDLLRDLGPMEAK